MAAPLGPLSIVRKVRHVGVVADSNGLVMSNLRTSSLHILDTTAAEVWQRIDGERTLSDIADDLAATYRHTTAADTLPGIVDYVAELIGVGVVELVS